MYKFLDSKFLYILCFASGSLYSIGLTSSSLITQNVFTVIFIIFLALIFYTNCKKIFHNVDSNFLSILFQIISLHLGIATSALLFNLPNSFFWMIDSEVLHLPESIKFIKFFTGDFNSILNDVGQRSGRTTHAFTGLFFTLFGVHTFGSILAQLFFKVIILIFIFKTCILLWDNKRAEIATLLYGLCPTVFFYNLVLYKEGAVQCAFIGVIYFSLQIFLKKHYRMVSGLLIFMLILAGERNYIAGVCFPMIVFLLYDSFFEKTRKSFLIFLTLIALFTSLPFILNYLDFNFIFTELKRIRSTHQVFSDVLNKYNYDIPYPVALIKILFSPYFTINKFKIFTAFSTLLIWGSFLNQLIILCSVLGLLKSIKQKMFHLYLWIPFILFLIFAAYISPWAGRLRDSFYPLIACYAANYLYNNKYFQKLFRIKNGQSKQS